MKTYYNTNAILERFNLPDDIQYTIYRKMFDNVLKDIACPECAICEERYNISKNKAEADFAGFGYGDYYEDDAVPDSCWSCFCSQNCLCSCEKCEVMFDLNDEMTKALRIDISEEYFFKTVDRFANPILFKKEKNKFIRGNDQNLILEKMWFDSFDI